MLTETIARGWENLLGRNSHATMLLEPRYNVACSV